MARCDLCGEACKAIDLTQLLEQYQVDGVVDLCPKCRRWADDLKSSMLLEIPPRMRQAIAERAIGAHVVKPGMLVTLPPEPRPWGFWTAWRRR